MGVSGHVEKPGVYEAPLGVSLKCLVEDYCGGMRGGKGFKAAIAGGASMGILSTDQYEAEMDFDIGRKYDLMGLGTACPPSSTKTPTWWPWRRPLAILQE